MLAGRVGLAATLLGAGVVYFVVTMLPAVLPSWREFGRRPSEPGISADTGLNAGEESLAGSDLAPTTRTSES